MKRACFFLKVKKGLLEEYKNAHKEVWPEMLEAIRRAGMKNYSLFLRRDGLLVGYFEAEDPQESLRKVRETKANRRWQKHMARYFESGSGDLQKGNPEWLEQIFYLA